MREWSLTENDPLALRIAADTRLTATDYADDQAWELTLTGGEPPALALRTTYGLRARDMRLFPIFGEGDTTVYDPAAFVQAPRVRAAYVNHLRVTFVPLPGVSVTAHWWAAESQVIAGQLTLVNEDGDRPERDIRLALAGLLKPLDNPQTFGPSQREEYTVLEGHTGNLDILLAMEGEVTGDSAPFPLLTQSVHLTAHTPVTIRWACAARPGAAESLVLVRDVFAREWEAEFARIELANASLIEFETGDPEWDAAFAFAQNVALRCYVGPTPHLPNPSFIFSRNPDRGYSRKGDGSDHPWLWDGQVATEAYVNLPQIAAAAPELAKGVIYNWLAIQDEKGFIDWKPGLAGQRNKALCIPLLATIAWDLYERTEDKAFLENTYLGLYRFFNVWFSSRHDRDSDGVPEWTHTIQSAFDDNPSFVRWQPWAQAADISAVEAPDLIAYLYREAESLRKIRDVLGRPVEPEIEARASTLAEACQRAWSASESIYRYLDRDTHTAGPALVLAEGSGNLAVDIGRRLPTPARIVVRAVGPRDERVEMTVTLAGKGRGGRNRVETFKRSQVQWYFGVASGTSDKAFTELDRVEIGGLSDAYTTTISTVDLTRQDQTLLLPLWAGLPTPAQAEALVRQTVLDPERFWRPFGIPNCSAKDPVYRPDNRGGSGGVWMMWTTMLGEGLLEYGYRAEAAELITRLMNAIGRNLKEDRAFSEAYNAETGEGIGERDYLWGVAPVALFLKSLGVRLVTPRRVHVSGRSPWPRPVTVRWRGCTITRDGDRVSVSFPTGRTVHAQGETAQFIEDTGE